MFCTKIRKNVYCTDETNIQYMDIVSFALGFNNSGDHIVNIELRHPKRVQNREIEKSYTDLNLLGVSLTLICSETSEIIIIP